jgi:hypothetical protein
MPCQELNAPATMNLVRDGAMRIGAGLTRRALAALDTALADLPPERAGIRITGMRDLDPYLRGVGEIGAIAGAVLGDAARPVRAILFDKTPHTNWRLGWHQDRTIAVRARVETPGYGPWSMKGGLQHVAPPFDVLDGMVTLRVHLDPAGSENAPLLVAPGSHRLGVVPQARIATAVASCGQFACLAEPGDVWVYATPILHASHAAASPTRRRVLQVDYAARDLPGRLEWLGV